MKAEQLRKSILQMAIQGKLVPQNPDDEPASVLLEKIRAEKQKLIKEGKIKKDKNESIIFKGDDNRPYEKVGNEVRDIIDELPFEIPDSWEWVRLKNYSLIIFSGKSPKYSKEITPHKVIGQQANQWYGVDMQFCKYCTEEFALNMTKEYYLQNGDVLLNTLGNGTLGRSGVFFNNLSNTPVLTDGHLFVFRNLTIELSYYLLIYLKIKYEDIVRSANGSTNQTFLNLGNTLEWLIPVPPQEEIKRIVAEIEKYEPLLAEYDKLEQQATKLDTEIYDKLKKSILQYAIQGKLVPQNPADEPASVLLERIRAEKKAKLGKKYVESYIYKGDDNCYYEHIGDKDINITEDIPFDLPNNWYWEYLGNILYSLTDGTHNTPKYIDKGIPFLSVKNISSHKLDFTDTKFISYEQHKELSLRCNPQKGDILLSKVGTTGIPVIVDTDQEFSLFVSIALLKYDQKLLNSNYLIYLLDSPLVQLQAKENTRGVANKNWVLTAIAKTLIVVPPLAEQQRIVNKINEIFAKI